MPLGPIIKLAMVMIGIGAMWSALLNAHNHHAYAFASRLALFSAALTGFVNSAGLERLIRRRPLVAVIIGVIFVAMIGGYYILFTVVFPPPN